MSATTDIQIADDVRGAHSLHPVVRLPLKARWGTACNGCGLCCAKELCVAGEMAFPGASAPCPALKIRGDGKSTYCQLVAIEIVAGLTPMLQEALGIGKGCSMRDENEAIDAAMEEDARQPND